MGLGGFRSTIARGFSEGFNPLGRGMGLEQKTGPEPE